MASGESRELRGHTQPVFDIALRDDGRLVASGSSDGTVRIWPVRLPPRPEELADWLARATRVESDLMRE